MIVDLSKYKVIYNDRVLKALTLQDIVYPEDVNWDATIKEPKFIEILCINEDGTIEACRDETWRFQFIPVLDK